MDLGTFIENISKVYYHRIAEFTEVLSITKRDGKYIIRMRVKSNGRKIFMEIDAQTGEVI